MSYRKKETIVNARIVTADDGEIVETPHGSVLAEKGDYVLTDIYSGDTWPVKAEIFKRTYEEIEP